jgi:hypothetical protein
MTKEELVAVVDRIYASWNQHINPNNQKVVYEAWWRILKDLDKEATDVAVDSLVIQDSYMPRPGQVRKLVVNSLQGWCPPTAVEAWQQFRRMAEAAHTGSYSEGVVIDSLVKDVVRQLGGTQAYNLHTNSDRQQFVDMYEFVLRQREQELYQLQDS